MHKPPDCPHCKSNTQVWLSPNCDFVCHRAGCPMNPIIQMPTSRGTTHGQLMQMHASAEQDSMTKGPLEDDIRATCTALADFLCAKNRAYGNSFGAPIGVFAKRADALLAMDVRIDDKLNRLARGSEYPGDDTVKDLAGYLVLRMVVAEKVARESGTNHG